MTMFSDIATTPPFIRKRFSIFLVRLGRHINRRIAAAIARRERQAALALRYCSDRDLQDIGICRYQIGDALADCEQQRHEKRRSELL